MLKTTVLVTFGLLLAAALPAWAGPSRPISKRELRDQPQAQSSQQVMGQVADLFITDAPKPPTTPQRVLLTDGFQTRPRGADIKGMCLIDVLWVEFEPVRPGGPLNADTPTRASGFTALRYYAFVDPPGPTKLWAYADSPRDTDCSKTDFWKSGYFLADSDDEAAGGYRVLMAFREALAAGTVTPTCDLPPNEAKQDCKAAVAALAPADLESIETCDAEPGTGQECYRYGFWDHELTLVGRPMREALPIVSARMSWRIVLAEPIAD